jgi:hypothetical protein
MVELSGNQTYRETVNFCENSFADYSLSQNFLRGVSND